MHDRDRSLQDRIASDVARFGASHDGVCAHRVINDAFWALAWKGIVHQSNQDTVDKVTTLVSYHGAQIITLSIFVNGLDL